MSELIYILEECLMISSKLKLLAVFFILVVSLQACAAKELEPGRCDYNSDCKEGEKCEETRCEDIYYPRHQIKPF